jgi:FTR1 family protein
MWIGVASAIGLSIVIGVVINVVVHELPQRPQEMMETVIGAVAVVLVTGMVLWMSTHARFMRRDLEAHAASALSEGTVTALAVMAFLAVLKEGFETSVFLLATFQHATDALEAALGVIIGIGGAVGIGYGLYKGGISLNLGRFFKVTSAFLILVAAGLVVTTVRTAYEAGWITGGQSATVDLSWLAPGGSSVQGALVTGVLGIPPHPSGDPGGRLVRLRRPDVAAAVLAGRSEDLHRRRPVGSCRRRRRDDRGRRLARPRDLPAGTPPIQDPPRWWPRDLPARWRTPSGPGRPRCPVICSP